MDASTAAIRKKTPLNQKLSFWIIILVIILLIAWIRQQNNSHSRQRDKQLPAVVLTKVTTKDIPIYLSALGGVIPTYSVTVKTQVNGQLLRVLFREGQMVKKGELLAEIDDRPYQAQLTEYQGQYERDKAQLTNALIDLKRYQTLWKQDSVSQQTLTTQKALVKQLQGTLKLDEGLLQATKVNLAYTKITSPIDGRIGLRLIDAGNIIQTSDPTGIAVVNMMNPITVVFTIAEDNIPAVLEQLDKNKTLSVEAWDRQQTKKLAIGQLLTIDNQINTSTGTVKLKAEFQNKKNELFPNQFVNVRLLLKTLQQATVIPTAAVQHGTKGDFVYLFNANQTVSAKPIAIIATTEDNTVISSGVSVGQSVVIEGADKLTDGAKVSDVNQPANPSQKQSHTRRRATA